MPLGINPKSWISSFINGMHWVIMSMPSISLVGQMGSQPNWSVIFIFIYLIFSQLLAARVNLLTNSLNGYMDQPTNAMWSNKLPSAIKDLNMHIFALERKQLHACTQKKPMDNEDNRAKDGSDLRYHISPLKNWPVDIVDTIWNNRDVVNNNRRESRTVFVILLALSVPIVPSHLSIISP